MNSLPTSTVVAVIGAGTMGAGIAQVAAAAGHSVLLYDAQEGATGKGIQAITVGLQKRVSSGKMSELDYAMTKRLAIAVGEQACESAVREVAGFSQAIGLQVSRIRDVPGLVVARTVAMIVNEAADAANHGVCSLTDVDIAMKVGG